VKSKPEILARQNGPTPPCLGVRSVVRRGMRLRGFSLGEMVVTVVIGGMILAVILGIYGRANQTAGAVLAKIEGPALVSEVLQLIADDVDRTFGADDVFVQIRNGPDNGFARAELVLRRVYHDKDNKEQVLEEITWRAAYDSESVTPGLILYRSREGAGQEDKLLEDQREDWERNVPFVPVCRGATFFRIQACKGEELLDTWPLSAAPAGVKITISFAEPYQTARGTWEVPDEEKISRTFVVNAMRKIKFAMNSSEDPNQVDSNEPTAETRSPTKDETRTGTTATQSIRGPVTNERTPTQTRRR
jgi:hypothetical protein